MILRLFPFASFKFSGLFFENRAILWESINYPKLIFKELINMHLWAPTYFQHFQFHLPFFISYNHLVIVFY